MHVILFYKFHMDLFLNLSTSQYFLCELIQEWKITRNVVYGSFNFFWGTLFSRKLKTETKKKIKNCFEERSFGSQTLWPENWVFFMISLFYLFLWFFFLNELFVWMHPGFCSSCSKAPLSRRYKPVNEVEPVFFFCVCIIIFFFLRLSSVIFFLILYWFGEKINIIL